MHDFATTRNSEPSKQCPLCKKTFVKESTRKRHYYYCRSRRPDANASRRRSCAACVRAKTRCTWLANTGLKICTRCDERGSRCQYDGDLGPGHDDSDSQGSTAPSMISPEQIGAVGDLLISTNTQKSQGSPETLDALLDDNWDLNLEEIDPPDLTSDAIVLPCTSRLVSATLVTGLSSLEAGDFHFMTPYPFTFRTVTKQGHTPLVSLTARILQSYPFMLLEDGVFPPFLNPQMYSWAKAGKGRLQEILLNCTSLVQVFKSRTEANRNLIWEMIRLEQERISADHASFDQWELLASLQALLVYCLLRLQDEPGGQDGFDSSLLTTVNLVSTTLSLLVSSDCSLPADSELAWRGWIFNESRRRTALVFRALSMLLDISNIITCFPATGFGLIPLPSKLNLWGAGDVGKWRTAFDLCCKEGTLYALSENGGLKELKRDDAGIQQSPGEWGEWAAGVGDMGTLAMTMGELLR